MEEKSKLIQAYKDLTLETGQFPVSIFAVCEKAGVERPKFHDHFGNFGHLQQALWEDYFYTTVRTIEGADQYATYMVREKLLAFYFTFLEVLGQDREFVCRFEKQLGIWNYNPECLKDLKPLFLAFLTELVEEGKSSEEIAERYVLGNDYPGWHWPQFLYLVNFWMRDRSEGYQRTDQAVEKAVNMGFDIMGRNVLDSVFDFARFAFTNQRS